MVVRGRRVKYVLELWWLVGSGGCTILSFIKQFSKKLPWLASTASVTNYVIEWI
jgi:hypothetical protein